MKGVKTFVFKFKKEVFFSDNGNTFFSAQTSQEFFFFGSRNKDDLMTYDKPKQSDLAKNQYKTKKFPIPRDVTS